MTIPKSKLSQMKRTKRSAFLLEGSGPEATRARIKAVLQSDDRIPYVSKHGSFMYNWWKDAKNPKGLLRRTTLADYITETPEWEVVMDLDLLAKQEEKDWHMNSMKWQKTDGARMIMRLSPTGGDRAVLREFDVEAKQFIADGFMLNDPVRCYGGQLEWEDADTLLIASDQIKADAGESGAIMLRRWKRGQAYAQSPIIFRAEETDSAVFSILTIGEDEADSLTLFGVNHTYDDISYFLHRDGGSYKLPVPREADCSFHAGMMSLYLRVDWEFAGRAYSKGSLLLGKTVDIEQGKANAVQVLLEPHSTELYLLSSARWTRNYFLYTVLKDVKQVIHKVRLRPNLEPAGEVRTHDEFDTVGLQAVDPRLSDQLLVTRSGFLEPPTLLLGDVQGGFAVIKQEPAVFDTREMEVSQHFVKSLDGTSIPYFEIGRRGTSAKPTILMGYGGFGISELPRYQKSTGVAWLEKGYTLVVGNIRGGGEYGVAWREAVLGPKQHKRFEDLAAIAGDLIQRGVSTADQLGGMGGSCGGLLVGNMLTRYPKLFKALCIEVGVLDLERMSALPYGAAWIAEFGNPKEIWEEIKAHSPYHTLQADAKYPVTLFSSRTGDDRVHPAHSRRCYAKMRELGAEAYMLEMPKGGHMRSGAGVDVWAEIETLHYSFFEKMLVK